MSQITFSKPTVSDGKEIFRLVRENPPLDENSEYFYLLLCHHFSETCVVAKQNSQVVGFITGYVPPKEKKTLFVWQAAVSPKLRGKGLAAKMLYSILQRENLRNFEFVEATLAPSNKSSYSFLISFANDLGTNFTKSPLFTKDKFGESKHEEEELIRIGPFKTQKLVEVFA
ncbi:diaminobutyrate acetyltransferase [Nitrosopumilus sp. b1]|nr:diaminobutyrate acetyltransferase [Nitrosopumilus sp. b1]